MSVSIFHITHVSNLPSIVQSAGLWSARKMRSARAGSFVNVAHESIQVRRSTTLVPCGRGGVLHDYVPFYFAPRSPMLYTIERGNVEGYSDGQTPIVYLCAHVDDVVANALDFVFTDGHPTMRLSNWYTDLAHLGRIDWHVMRSRMWNDEPNHPDRKRKRQAEFLVHAWFPWLMVRQIVTINDTMRQRAAAVLAQAGAPHVPQIVVDGRWYY